MKVLLPATNRGFRFALSAQIGALRQYYLKIATQWTMRPAQREQKAFILASECITAMSLMSTLVSSSSSMNSLTSTTSSAITLSNIITGAAIAMGVLVLVLLLNQLMSWWRDSWNPNTAETRRLRMVAAFIPAWRDSWNANTAAALRAIFLPLIVTFCAFVTFKVALAL
jgi:hypothetical protein